MPRIPTEPIGSIPRPPQLLAAIERTGAEDPALDPMYEAAEYIPAAQLGTTDDCGFSPFSDDISTTREKAFAKIRARVEGTALAQDRLG